MHINTLSIYLPTEFSNTQNISSSKMYITVNIYHDYIQNVRRDKKQKKKKRKRQRNNENRKSSLTLTASLLTARKVQKEKEKDNLKKEQKKHVDLYFSVPLLPAVGKRRWERIRGRGREKERESVSIYSLLLSSFFSLPLTN